MPLFFSFGHRKYYTFIEKIITEIWTANVKSINTFRRIVVKRNVPHLTKIKFFAAVKEMEESI